MFQSGKDGSSKGSDVREFGEKKSGQFAINGAYILEGKVFKLREVERACDWYEWRNEAIKLGRTYFQRGKLKDLSLNGERLCQTAFQKEWVKKEVPERYGISTIFQEVLVRVRAKEPVL